MPISPPDGYNAAMNPTQLGPYEIKSRLGRGGMGAVYEAVDTTSGDTVAVKVLASHLTDDPGLRSRFEAEIDTLKNLRHPGIVRLLAFGEQDDQPFFAMELVRGKSLEQILRTGRRFTWRETIAIATEITRALKTAHDNGIVHRDLKPANLLVADALPAMTEPKASAAAAGGAERVTVKLADFGIAKLFGGVGHTALGHVVGTAEYMAPEQASGRPIDHRADLYSLGLVIFTMMTGAPPFRGTQLMEVIAKQKREIPPRVASLVADVPAELDELIARLLSKDPAQRPPSALALGRLLGAIETLYPETEVAAAQPAASTAGSPRGAAAGSPVAAGPTAQERSKKATRPLDPAAATGPVSLAGTAAPRAVPAASVPPSTPRADDLDLLAPTQPLPTPRAAAPSLPPACPPQVPPRPAARVLPTAGRPRPTAGNTGVTEDLKTNSPVPRTAASASPGQPSRPSTDVASAPTLVDRSHRNRFTTVANAERAAAEKARREQLWQLGVQTMTAAFTLVALAGGGWLLMKPPSADRLHQRILAIADDPHGDLRDARSEMESFLTQHAADPRAARVRELKHTLDLDILERRARRRSRGDKELSPLERDYRAAMTNEENGPSACVKALDAMLAVHASGSAVGDETTLWLEVARRKVEQLRPQAVAEQQDDAKRIGELLAEASSLAARADIANDETAQKKLLAQRRVILGNVVEVYAKRPHAVEAVAFATRELADQPSGTGSGTSPARNTDTPADVTPEKN
jgi:serine/threonine-protein kinase